ncbi:MAG: dienelactone hydrolase family protein [Cyclobacteriaceae bacterium]|nr:dienelactone hydrolase family protein [Cyclobacteriaceae bacterium]
MEHTKQLIEAGKPLTQAKKALIMLHGRGGSAEDILSLRTHLPVDDFYVIAPQATNCTWYPYSFLTPLAQNEPWLSSALRLVNEIVLDIEKAGIPSSQIYLLGFSQGACLTLEFATRHARQWGGVIALTGGLIGDKLYAQNYTGDFVGTRVLMTNSQNDPHVPLARSEDSKNQLEKMGAKVSLEIYKNRPHTILMEELTQAKLLLCFD